MKLVRRFLGMREGPQRAASPAAELPPAVRWYLGVYGLTTLLLLVWLLTQTARPVSEPPVLALVFLIGGILAASYPLTFGPKTKVRLLTTVMIATALVLDPGIAMLVIGVSVIISDALRRHPWDEFIFNSAQCALQVGAGGFLLAAAGWTGVIADIERPLFGAAALLAAGLMYLINTLSIGIIIGLQTGQPIIHTW